MFVSENMSENLCFKDLGGTKKKHFELLGESGIKKRYISLNIFNRHYQE